jgi:hypothetical protein
VARECPSRWAPYGSGPTAGPLGQGGAAGRELEPTVLSRPASRGRRNNDTSPPWGGDDEDDPNMLL